MVRKSNTNTCALTPTWALPGPPGGSKNTKKQVPRIPRTKLMSFHVSKCLGHNSCILKTPPVLKGIRILYVQLSTICHRVLREQSAHDIQYFLLPCSQSYRGRTPACSSVGSHSVYARHAEEKSNRTLYSAAFYNACCLQRLQVYTELCTAYVKLIRTSRDAPDLRFHALAWSIYVRIPQQNNWRDRNACQEKRTDSCSGPSRVGSYHLRKSSTPLRRCKVATRRQSISHALRSH